MKKRLAALLAAVLLTTLSPAALTEEIIAPVEMIDEAIPEADFVEMDSIELETDAELPAEAGLVSDDGHLADLPSFEESGGIPIDEAHFPDPAVRDKLLNDYLYMDVGVSKTYDQNKNGWLDTDEIAAITELTFIPGLSDLRGLEYLTALERLSFTYTGTTLVVPSPQI